MTSNVGAYILQGTPVVDDGIHDIINRGIKFADIRLSPLASVEIDETARGTGWVHPRQNLGAIL